MARERRVRERNKISVQGGGWRKRMSSTGPAGGRREDGAAGEHRARGEAKRERGEKASRSERETADRSSTKVSRPCPATRVNYPTSHFLPGCVPCFFDLG